jgi:hypothetical protein
MIKLTKAIELLDAVTSDPYSRKGLGYTIGRGLDAVLPFTRLHKQLFSFCSEIPDVTIFFPSDQEKYMLSHTIQAIKLVWPKSGDLFIPMKKLFAKTMAISVRNDAF